ncbi:hypothetical protein [Cohnella nanjingensis]|uniref:Lipoprotein n=1 Tax=Cohnella nanjingensis TaxID=1387779 RepID=A0A7X0RWA2_9BACL|nr:hypothetical protein [Cohnella nanjingensis]MBB6674838.1 hypothetical protein [Cohnella nanjingensis]
MTSHSNSKKRKAIAGMAAMLALSAVLAGCGKSGSGGEAGASPSDSVPAATAPASPSGSASQTPNEDQDAALIKAFRDKAKGDTGADALNKELDAALAAARQPETGDALLREMFAFYERDLPNAEKKFEAENVQKGLMKAKWPITADNAAEIKDETAKALVDKSLAGGYKLEQAEGFIFPVVDYGKLKRADAKVTPEMKDFVALYAMESDNKTAADAGLVIEWTELASRTIAAENYIKTYPTSALREKAEQRYMMYLNDLLIGLNNTPIFDFDTLKLDPKVKEVYTKTIQANPDTVTAKMTQQLLDILAKTNGTVFKKGKDGAQIDIPEVKAFRDGLEKNALDAMDQANPDK